MVRTGIFGALALTMGSQAYAATDDATANSVIVTPLSFFVIDELDFGNILAGPLAGTVIVAPNGARTATGGVTLMGGGTVQPVNFGGRGRPNQLVNISLSSSPNRLTRINGTERMTLDTFVIGSTPTTIITAAPLRFRIGGTGGVFNFPLGATLRVGANQAPGDYEGTFRITLNYL